MVGFIFYFFFFVKLGFDFVVFVGVCCCFWIYGFILNGSVRFLSYFICILKMVSFYDGYNFNGFLLLFVVLIDLFILVVKFC